MAPAGLNTYQKTSIQTADRRKIVVMLYEGVVKNLNNAIAALDQKDADLQTRKVSKALEIIQFLATSLDFENGDAIARNLSNLYDYARDVITLGNIQNDPDKLREAIKLFNTLLDGWRAILSSPDIDPNHEPPDGPPKGGAPPPEEQALKKPRLRGAIIG